jgi:hypothetical protein
VVATLALGLVAVVSVIGLRDGGKDTTAALQATAITTEAAAPPVTAPPPAVSAAASAARGARGAGGADGADGRCSGDISSGSGGAWPWSTSARRAHGSSPGSAL